MEIANKRRAMLKLNKKLGEMDLPANRDTGRKTKKKGPPPPTISVCFIDNTADGKLVRRMQRVEEEVSDKVKYRVRMTEAAGTPMSLPLTSNNPWGTSNCGREDCSTCTQGEMSCMRATVPCAILRMSREAGRTR